MQDRPDAGELLSAIQDFLLKEILPLVKEEQALAFKTLVSWNMLGVIEREWQKGEELSDHWLLSAREALAAPAGHERTNRQKLSAIEQLKTALAERIRAENILNPDHPCWKLAKELVALQLQVANPRFKQN
jgi:hypothetical protein